VATQHPTVVVRLTTVGGAVGWGEAMGIGGCGEAVKATIQTMVAPLLLGSGGAATGGGAAPNVVVDIEQTMRRVQQAQNRRGPHSPTSWTLTVSLI
jgi:L-alanine-DL-glutamate epimerase-like enolase superfamily enzyme